MPLEKFVSSPDMSYVIRLITEKGSAYARRYRSTKQDFHLTEAIRIFKIADRAFTRVKTVHNEMQSKLAWRSDARTLYEYAIDACYQGRLYDDAFYFFERSRAVLLNDQIFENRRMSDNDINTKFQIETKIGQLTHQLGVTRPNDKEYAEIQKNILLLNQQKDRITGPTSNSDTSGLTLKQFRNEYDFKNESLLEIFSGDSAVFIFLLSQNNIQLKKINRERFNHLSAAFNEYVVDPVRSNSNFPDFVTVANELYKLVFDSLHTKGSRLIVSPDENNFPFEALVTEASDGKKPVYLVQGTSVVYTYSAGFLLLDFNLSNDRSVPLVLGLAPVRFPEDYHLTELTGSDASLNKITAFLRSSQIISGKKATKGEFLKHFHKFRIVQLYTHGTASGDADVPVIYFADSALNLFDLLPQSKTATQLIVLSACETGKGEYFKGEGVFSFNRAFAQAGIPSSMVNLWSVDNQSTYRLTELFYRYLAKGNSYDEALQLAKVECLSASQRERSLPFYWAAMVFAGQPSPDLAASKFPWIVTAAIAIALLALVIIAFRRFSYRAPYR
jgi:CHAT domain-containing protein